MCVVNHYPHWNRVLRREDKNRRFASNFSNLREDVLWNHSVRKKTKGVCLMSPPFFKALEWKIDQLSREEKKTKSVVCSSLGGCG